MHVKKTNLTRVAALCAAASFALVACGTDSTDDAAPSSTADASGERVEQHSATPRLALSYDGGILVLDAENLEQVADIPTEG